jgi:arabinan endo-1,5-alpha-L-arabinosidase
VITKLVRLLSILALVLVMSNNVLAASVHSKNIASIQGVTNATVETYTNPLPVKIPNDGLVESCADPTIIRGQAAGDNNWYMYCTTDPLNGNDKTDGNFNFHLIPMLRSSDLVNWTYEGDAFSSKPAWVAPHAGLWAPEITFFNGQYYLYYTASDTSLPGGGSAIGVATSNHPLGPWEHSEVGPVVEPHAADCCPGSRRWVFDPDVVEADGQRYIFYGSYFGGISVRTLSADGLHSDPASQKPITIANRYEGTEVIRHDGYWYLFASATDCCRGPLTGYSVFAGRSQNILGPYVDREGNSLLQGRVGGTPVISMNGNRWVGTGHNSVFEDLAGQTWTVYHAVDRNDPYFAGAVGFTKRPVLLDPLDWVDGWPTVRGGLWASDSAQPVPVTQPGSKTKQQVKSPPQDQPAGLISSLSDEFNSALGEQWSWIREPAASTYSVSSESLNFDTQPTDLFVDSNNASVLVESAPSDNYIVETKVRLNLPPEGCCFNYVQAGLVIYVNDDNYVKLVPISIWETRQTEFAKELAPVPAGYPRYGNTVVGAPGEWTYLRIVKRTNNEGELYTAYTSVDGLRWVRGGTWTHQLGSNAQIGLVSMGGSGFTANFDYLRVYHLDD